jgi:hypothetical protein
MKIKYFGAIVCLLFIPATAFATYGVQIRTEKCTANQVLPDSACTPGAIFPVATSTICVTGYTSKVRDVPLSLKKQVFKEYGISYDLHSNYEVDHLISLELGGSNDISNLWPESYLINRGSRTKDSFENYLHDQVCKGNMSLVEAHRQISTDWAKFDNTRRSPEASLIIENTASPAVKKSSSGICHARGTAYYAATKTFKAFTSLALCLTSGGRLPK